MKKDVLDRIGRNYFRFAKWVEITSSISDLSDEEWEDFFRLHALTQYEFAMEKLEWWQPCLDWLKQGGHLEGELTLDDATDRDRYSGKVAFTTGELLKAWNRVLRESLGVKEPEAGKEDDAKVCLRAAGGKRLTPQGLGKDLQASEYKDILEDFLGMKQVGRDRENHAYLYTFEPQAWLVGAAKGAGDEKEEETKNEPQE